MTPGFLLNFAGNEWGPGFISSDNYTNIIFPVVEQDDLGWYDPTTGIITAKASGKLIHSGQLWLGNVQPATLTVVAKITNLRSGQQIAAIAARAENSIYPAVQLGNGGVPMWVQPADQIILQVYEDVLAGQLGNLNTHPAHTQWGGLFFAD